VYPEMPDYLIIDPNKKRSWERYLANKRPYEALRTFLWASAITLSLATFAYSVTRMEESYLWLCPNILILPMYWAASLKVNKVIGDKITEIRYRDYQFPLEILERQTEANKSQPK